MGVARAGISLVLLLFSWGSTSRADMVRVRVQAGIVSVRLAGEDLRLAGERVDGGVIVVVAAEPEEGWREDGSPVVLSGSIRVEATGPVRVSGQALTGALTLHPSGDGTMDVVNWVPLEPYVERVVTSEAYATWPLEALKAQAVVARTYALHARGRSGGREFDLEGSVLSQRYGTDPVPGRVREATRATRGEYLAYGGAPILAAFHAAAGGKTAASDEVWSERLPYLQGVDSPDEEAPEYFWSYEIEADDLRSALEEGGLTPGSSDGVRVLERTPSGRVRRLEAFGLELSGRTLRELLGGRAILSTLFDVRHRGGRVRFLGSGAGHGVGLSQWGARQLALDGRSYGEILEHYFPGTALRVLDPDRELASGGEASP